MRIKIKCFDKLFIDEKICLKTLDELALQGWILKLIKGRYFIFKKESPQQLKYQIDYNEGTDEYKELIDSMGYIFVDSYQSCSIFYTYNLEAPQLQTDEVARYLALKKYYKIPIAILYILLGLFIISLLTSKILISLLVPRFTWGNFILSGWTIVCVYLFLILGIYSLFKGMRYLLIRHQESKKLKGIINYQLNLIIKGLVNINNIIINLITTIFIVFIITYLILRPYFLILILVIVPICLIYLNKNDFKKRFEKIYYGAQLIIICSLVIIKIVGFDNIQKENNINKGTDKSLFYTNDWLINSNNEDEIIFSEKIYDCLNSWVADEIFKEMIIEARRDIDYPTSQEINRIVKQKGSFSGNEIAYPKYLEAFKSFKELNSNYVEQAYYLNNWVVAIKNNKVFAGELLDLKSADEILKYYFSN